MTDRIEIGGIAGTYIRGKGDIQVARHVKRGNDRGYRINRKRIVDRVAYEYDPTMGWEIDVWFEWVPAIPFTGKES